MASHGIPFMPLPNLQPQGNGTSMESATAQLGGTSAKSQMVGLIGHPSPDFGIWRDILYEFGGYCGMKCMHSIKSETFCCEFPVVRLVLRSAAVSYRVFEHVSWVFKAEIVWIWSALSICCSMKNSLACGGVASCFKMSLMVVCPETSNSFFLGLFESGNATTH